MANIRELTIRELIEYLSRLPPARKVDLEEPAYEGEPIEIRIFDIDPARADARSADGHAAAQVTADDFERVPVYRFGSGPRPVGFIRRPR